MAKTAQRPADDADDHRLVAEFRKAMEQKDLVTMGRMLELLGTMRAELLMGKPVIDKLAGSKKESGAGGASAKTGKSRSLMARLPR